MSELTEEDIIARAAAWRDFTLAAWPHEIASAFLQGIVYGDKQAAKRISESLEARAAEIEAEGSASIFAGPVVAELRQQAKRLTEMYTEGE